MAAVTLNNQTLAGLLEVGDQVRTGQAPDDFVTVLARFERPTYVKLRVSLFDLSETDLRVRYTDPVMIVPPGMDLNAEEEPTE